MKTLNEFLKNLGLGEPRTFQPSALVDVENRVIDIILEDVAYYFEWLEGEGADIGIYRAMDGGRVIGARLPLKIWNGKFPVEII